MHSDRHISNSRDLTISWDKLSFVLRIASRIHFACQSKCRIDSTTKGGRNQYSFSQRLAERWQYIFSRALTYLILSSNRGIKDSLILDNLSISAEISSFDHAVLIAALSVCHTRCFPSFIFKSLSLCNNSLAINVALLQISIKLSRFSSISASDCGFGADGMEFSGSTFAQSFTSTACRSLVTSSSSPLTFNDLLVDL